MKPLWFLAVIDGQADRRRHPHEGPKARRRPMHALSPISPSPPSPAAADDFDAKLREAERHTRSRFPRDVVFPKHQIAPFMVEITAFVETQLQRIAKRYSASTEEEQATAFRLRREVFSSALRMFGDAFETYRLFLNAIESESNAYVQYLTEALTRAKADVEFQKSERSRELQQYKEAQLQWEAERASLSAALVAERSSAEKQRMSHLEKEVRDKSTNFDAKKQLQDLQVEHRVLQDQLDSVRKENERLERIADTLTIDTFTDKVARALAQVRELREQNAVKEEQLEQSQNMVLCLTRDARRLVEALQTYLKREVTEEDVPRLSTKGRDVIFGLPRANPNVQ